MNPMKAAIRVYDPTPAVTHPNITLRLADRPERS